MLRFWGAGENYFQGAEEFSFRDLGRSMHYFQGSREHRPQRRASLCVMHLIYTRGMIRLSNCDRFYCLLLAKIFDPDSVGELPACILTTIFT